ncbi:pentatricopeptide repeat-containing protein At2g06000-like [Abrus precatorius]|uniref:Pentatricopeptide repeat-containing protein At2g06000-like n=1 Tax=Abrus precatorius TaxID=3816 RepID=A0A8B8MMA6_ABRPR|nr:pentatricopeptide repeat-containing protein At2g06000-like [Abrus precatorius]
MIFSLFTTIRASHYHTLTQVRASDKGLLITPDSWFVKIVSTFFLCPNPLDDRFLGYFHKHLTPSLVLEVVKRLNNPSLGFKFSQFTSERLNVPHSFWTYNMLEVPLRSRLDVSKELLVEAHWNKVQGAYEIRPLYRNLYFQHFNPRIHKVDRACDLLKEVCLNVISYTTVISGYCRLGGMAFALGMHKKMLLHGYPPSVVNLTSLIDGYCRDGWVNHGLDLWHEMNARNIPANLYTFSVLISALCKSNRLQEARDLLRLLKQSDIVPVCFVYNPVNDGYCKSGNIDEANAIVAK